MQQLRGAKGHPAIPREPPHQRWPPSSLQATWCRCCGLDATGGREVGRGRGLGRSVAVRIQCCSEAERECIVRARNVTCGTSEIRLCWCHQSWCHQSWRATSDEFVYVLVLPASSAKHAFPSCRLPTLPASSPSTARRPPPSGRPSAPGRRTAVPPRQAPHLGWAASSGGATAPLGGRSAPPSRDGHLIARLAQLDDQLDVPGPVLQIDTQQPARIPCHRLRPHPLQRPQRPPAGDGHLVARAAQLDDRVPA
jgi:hypothetical protein